MLFPSPSGQAQSTHACMWAFMAIKRHCYMDWAHKDVCQPRTADACMLAWKPPTAAADRALLLRLPGCYLCY